MQLASWSGRPLDARNVGAYLEASTLVCRIAQPGQLEAILAIDQEELDFVRAGQQVDLLLANRCRAKVARGQIDRIAEENMQAAPTRLAARAGGQPSHADRSQAASSGRSRSSIRPTCPLDDPTGRIVIGATGLAHIHAGYQPLWQRLWRSRLPDVSFQALASPAEIRQIVENWLRVKLDFSVPSRQQR